MRFFNTKLVFGILFLICSGAYQTYGQWQKATNLTGGSIATNIIQYQQSRFVHVSESGVFKSTDEGNTWKKTNLPPIPGLVNFINHKTLLYLFSSDSVYWTADGNSWSKMKGPGETVASVSSDGVNLFAGTNTGIFKSTDDGRSWSLTPGTNDRFIISMAANGSTILAAPSYSVNGYIMKSDDNGLNWTEIVTNLGGSISVFLKGNNFYLSVLGKGVYRSADRGASWQLVRSDIFPGTLSVTTDALYYLSNYRLYSSINNGDIWLEVKDSRGAPYTYNTGCIYAAGQYVFWGTWGGGVYRIPLQGKTDWEPVNEGIAAHNITDLVVIDNVIYVAAKYSFIKSSNDEGITWDQKKNADAIMGGNSSKLLAVNLDLYSGTMGDGIQFSSDRGQTWKTKNSGLSSLMITTLAKTTKSVFAGTSSGVYVTTNKGDNWSLIGSDIFKDVQCIYATETTVYVGASTGLYVSENEGATWNKISDSLSNQSVRSITSVSDFLIVYTNGGMYRTKDKGVNWESMNLFVDAKPIKTYDNKYVFFGRRMGDQFLVSYDLGETISDISSPYPFSSINAIAFTSKHIVVGTPEGVWLRELLQVIPPMLSAYTFRPDSKFSLGQSIFIQSDQELKSDSGLDLNNSDLKNYLSVKDSNGVIMDYTAMISSDKKIINIVITAAVEGNEYTVSTEHFKNVSGLTSPLFTSKPFVALSNHNPVISKITLKIDQDKILQFSEKIFSNAFSDEDGDILTKIKMKTLPQHGVLKLNDVSVTFDQEITKDQLSQLKYTPEMNFTGDDKWMWNGFDVIQYSLSDAEVNVQVTPVTAISDQSDGLQVQLFPNPVDSKLNIDFSKQKGFLFNLKIVDVMGRELKNNNFSKSEVNQAFEIDISEFSAGVYIVVIHTENYKVMKKIVKR